MLLFSGKIPVRVNPFFWLLAALIGWINTGSVVGTVVWIFIILFSVLIHEFGHALTAVAFGQNAQIELTGFGGLTQRGGTKLKLWQEFLIVLNGPVAGLILFAVAFQIHRMISDKPMNLVIYAVQITAAVNLFWTIINLIPVQPLDGGRLLSIILEAAFGFRGVKISLLASIIVAGVIGLLFFSLGLLLPGALFLMLGFESYRSWKSTLTMTDQDRDTSLQDLLEEAEAGYRQGNPEALEKLYAIREKAQAGMIYVTATEYLADILSKQGHPQKAYELLTPLRKKLSPEFLRLLHYLAYETKQWQEAITLGNSSYQALPHYDTALINALCHAVMGEVQPAVGWLKCAIREGLPNLQEALQKREFDIIRDDPSFQELKQS